MNEKLDFQEMKSIHEIMVTGRDIQEAFNDETGIPLHLP
jgi:carbamoylphosphate synthase large subunit